MDKLRSILDRLPQFYDGDNPLSVIHNVVKAIVDEYNITYDNINRVDNMIGVDTTYGADLQYRWGNLLMIPRKDGESDESYRNRLKISVTQLTGGTSYSIKYSIGVGLGINHSETEMSRRIRVLDAWAEDINAEYGNINCHIDLNNEIYTPEIESIVIESINSVKASGVNANIIFYNYRIVGYIDLDNITYSHLDTIKYSDLGV